MTVSATETKKRLLALMRLGRKIEATALDEAQEGFIRNQFGTYDSATSTEKLLKGFEELLSESPGDEYVEYLFAGALTRASRFDQAVLLYRGIISRDGQYSSPSAMLLPLVYWYAGDKASAQAALDDYNASFISKGIAPQHERVEQMFAPGTAF